MTFYLASKAEVEDMNDIIHSVQKKKHRIEKTKGNITI